MLFRQPALLLFTYFVITNVFIANRMTMNGDDDE
jgi:hypothetical protein